MPRLLAELHQAFTEDSMQGSGAWRSRAGRPGAHREKQGCLPCPFSMIPEPRQHGRDDAVAALAGKREDVDGRGVEVARQGLTQQRTRPEEPRPDGCLWDAEQVGRFLHRHLFDVTHDEHRTECRRQLIDAALEQTAQLGAQRRGRRGLRPFVSGLFGAAGPPAPLPSNGTTTRSRFWRRSRISD